MNTGHIDTKRKAVATYLKAALAFVLLLMSGIPIYYFYYYTIIRISNSKKVSAKQGSKQRDTALKSVK